MFLLIPMEGRSVEWNQGWEPCISEQTFIHLTLESREYFT